MLRQAPLGALPAPIGEPINGFSGEWRKWNLFSFLLL